MCLRAHRALLIAAVVAVLTLGCGNSVDSIPAVVEASGWVPHSEPTHLEPAVGAPPEADWALQSFSEMPSDVLEHLLAEHPLVVRGLVHESLVKALWTAVDANPDTPDHVMQYAYELALADETGPSDALLHHPRVPVDLLTDIALDLYEYPQDLDYVLQHPRLPDEVILQILNADLRVRSIAYRAEVLLKNRPEAIPEGVLRMLSERGTSERMQLLASELLWEMTRER